MVASAAALHVTGLPPFRERLLKKLETAPFLQELQRPMWKRQCACYSWGSLNFQAGRDVSSSWASSFWVWGEAASEKSYCHGTHASASLRLPPAEERALWLQYWPHENGFLPSQFKFTSHQLQTTDQGSDSLESLKPGLFCRGSSCGKSQTLPPLLNETLFLTLNQKELSRK